MSDETVIPEADNSLSPDAIQKAFESAEQKAIEAQELHSQAAQDAGYTREVIQVTTDFYVELARLAEDDPQYIPFVASGVQFVNSIGTELHQSNEQTRALVLGLSEAAASASVFCDTSGSISTVLGSNVELPVFESPPSFVIKKTGVEEKLFSIDPALLNTYQEIGQAYHGTTADPARAAISMMRQAFDHLFDKLAPDDKVIASPYWNPKPPSEPSQVTRKERMLYAAHNYIHDSARATTVIAIFDHIIETYKILNKLHKRGALSEKQARTALRAMQTFIETFAEAVELSTLSNMTINWDLVHRMNYFHVMELFSDAVAHKLLLRSF